MVTKNKLVNKKNYLVNNKNSTECCCGCLVATDNLTTDTNFITLRGSWNSGSLTNLGNGTRCDNAYGLKYYNTSTQIYGAEVTWYYKSAYNTINNQENGRLYLGLNPTTGEYYYAEVRHRPDLDANTFQLIIGNQNGIICYKPLYSIEEGGVRTFVLSFGIYSNKDDFKYLAAKCWTNSANGTDTSLGGLYTYNSISCASLPGIYAGLGNADTYSTLSWYFSNLSLYSDTNSEDCLTTLPTCCGSCEPNYFTVVLNPSFTIKSRELYWECIEECDTPTGTVDPGGITQYECVDGKIRYYVCTGGDYYFGYWYCYSGRWFTSNCQCDGNPVIYPDDLIGCHQYHHIWLSYEYAICQECTTNCGYTTYTSFEAYLLAYLNSSLGLIINPATDVVDVCTWQKSVYSTSFPVNTCDSYSPLYTSQYVKIDVRLSKTFNGYFIVELLLYRVLNPGGLTIPYGTITFFTQSIYEDCLTNSPYTLYYFQNTNTTIEAHNSFITLYAS